MPASSAARSPVAGLAVLRLGDLVADLVVVRRTLDLAEDADRDVRHRAVVEPGDLERLRRVVRVGVVHELVVADPHRLAVLEPDQPGLGLVLVLEHVERAVVEDRAVLVDLDERGAAVRGGRLAAPR